MKLLFDQNLSHKLVAGLSDLFPGSVHVRDFGMAAAEDCSIWEFAKSGDFSIASKDGDFHQLSLVRGAPPKVIWLRVGNASTDLVAQLIRSHFDEIEAFNIGEGSLLVLDL